MTTLFDPLAAGALRLPNRILMAAMTRSRANDDGIVGPMTARYYAQRADAGLIFSEGIYPEPMGKGYIRTPGLASAAQAAAWRRVTDAVHASGGRIAAQLMHAGRISDPSLLPGGATPVAPSAVRPSGATYTDHGMVPHVTPRALSGHEIRVIIGHYGAAARRALEAGFDAVELHAGNGFLPMQFLSTGTNRRDDAYGGGAQNRARFTVEALEAIAAAIGADRTGLKISPGKALNDMSDADPLETHLALLRAIKPLRLAFLEVAPDPVPAVPHAALRPHFAGAYFAGSGFDRTTGTGMVGQGLADAIVYGQLFLANPDLPRRFAENAPLARADQETFYSGGERGYIDYPALPEQVAVE